MEVNELRKRISVVNSTVARLNEQRVKNEGMRETLEKQRSEAIKAYSEKYGVDLTTVDINEEYNRVVQAKEAEVNLLTEAISCIESGDYARANQLLGISVEGSKEVKLENTGSVIDTNSISSQTEIPSVSAPVDVAPPTPMVAPTPAVQHTVVAPTPQVVQPTVSIAPPPTVVSNTVPSGIGAPVPTVAPPPMSGLNVPPIPTVPTSVPTPAASKMQGLDLSGLQVNAEAVNKATDFSSILNGNMFTP